MTKTELKKAKVSIRSGYYHGSYCIFEVEKPVEKISENGHKYTDCEVIARIDTKHLTDFLTTRIKSGLFEIGEKGRKYQYITMK